MKKGFSALEILIALSILALLAALTVGYLSGLQRAVALDGAVESIVSLIREARTKTLASENNSEFGIHFEESRVILFVGNSFVDGAPENKIYNVPDAVRVFNINLGGSNDLIFKRLTGEPETAVDVSVGAKISDVDAKTIFVNNAGLIYVE